MTYRIVSAREKALLLFAGRAFVSMFLLAVCFYPDSLSAKSDTSQAEILLANLGCAGCHFGLPESDEVFKHAPDLSDAGLKFTAPYLFEYLQSPTKVRQHIWPTRMPDFKLSAKESLALTLFLGTLKREMISDVELPEALRTQAIGSSPRDGRSLLISFECLKCHSFEGEGQNDSIDLTSFGSRLNADWVRLYLVSPSRYDGSETGMPSYFYREKDNGTFTDLHPGAAGNISSLVAFLFSRKQGMKEELEQAFRDARRAMPMVTADLGEKIFLGQNCGACHRYSVAAKRWKNAPDLAQEGDRVQQAWLWDFLKEPTAIRPFGYFPGSGSRMPDFSLSESEVALVFEYLASKSSHSNWSTEKPRPQPLSRFAKSKARRLMSEKYACLGCHQLGEQGGRIGPNLANVKERLQPSYLFAVLDNPQAVDPQMIMPGFDKPDEQLNLIFNYLVQNDMPRTEGRYLSPADHPVYFLEESQSGQQLYLEYCAGCHGTTGNDDGFNAPYLPTPPTKHADASVMATRPDDTLYDGIHAGGLILNKSHMMPAWGSTLKSEEIWQLVKYIRSLCQCTGPEWSTDNK